ncbi:amino acid transporter-like protein [Cutaneotrichosporon oleaginosum]|uniref:Amino acid transporter-like protein n=1 Tax=Cutaneotrichosporon oleaginosum TaxID=879819 RepID=A0A0J0XMC3_9TREE|nr:amino acid transporter-like protein [Cutaneotrichosporon oleaginosum]KLT42271.1 amino acid transporter-like protein [Cutaneotrichosporon oleaginosum]TXT11443.1 hypothetical protein COLE_01853 [Cutaneotrichosporon oleaginosum]
MSFDNKDKYAAGDVEVVAIDDDDKGFAPENTNIRDAGKLQRGLSSRHITWIGFGGGIGVGLFVGIGQSLAIAGPLGILISFLLTGFNVWCVMQSIGEIVAQYPVNASFPGFASRFVDPALGFTVGWTYWYNNAISVAVEVVAVAVLVDYWTDGSISPAVWITIGLVAIYCFNLLPVRWYGEAEVVTASIKVLTLLGLFICSLVISLGGAPDKDRRGFRYWRNPGAMNTYTGIAGDLGRFLALFRTLTNSAFAYGGTEVIVLTGAEAKDPNRQIPRNVKIFVYRQLFFYVGGALLVGMIVPYTHPDLVNGAGNAASSPWVIGIKMAGIKVLDSIVNAAIITSAWSAGNTYMYIASRTIRGLALNRQAPAILARTNKRGVPYFAVIATIPIGLLSYLSLGKGGASQAFNWLQNIIALNILLNWSMLCITFICYYRAMKAQGRDRRDLYWRGVLQPFPAYFAVTFSLIVCVFKGFPVFLKGAWNASDFVAAYISFPVYVVPFVAYKIIRRTQFVRPKEADLDRDQINPEDVVQEKVPTGAFGKIASKIFW